MRYVVFAFVLSLVGCAATPRDLAVKSVNASADIGTEAETMLASLDRAEQEWCLSGPPQDVLACVAGVRAKYHQLWISYRDYRATWLASAAAIRSYDASVAAKQNPSPDQIMAASSSLAEAAVKFQAALEQIKEGR